MPTCHRPSGDLWGRGCQGAGWPVQRCVSQATTRTVHCIMRLPRVGSSMNDLGLHWKQEGGAHVLKALWAHYEIWKYCQSTSKA